MDKFGDRKLNVNGPIGAHALLMEGLADGGKNMAR